jgi:hypothetical protein
MLKAIRSFLDTSLTAEPPSISGVVRSLDELALAYADTPNVAPSDDMREPPEHNYDSTYGVLRLRFPDLGYYTVVDPLQALEDPASVGDAIDDLADIAGELFEVLWRLETLGLEEAQWDFRFGYDTHWGTHLHSLRAYLHAKRRQDIA